MHIFFYQEMHRSVLGGVYVGECTFACRCTWMYMKCLVWGLWGWVDVCMWMHMHAYEVSCVGFMWVSASLHVDAHACTWSVVCGVYVGECMFAYGCTCMCVERLRLSFACSLNTTPSWFWEQGVTHDLVFSASVRLCAECVLEIHLSLPPQCWDAKDPSSDPLAFTL